VVGGAPSVSELVRAQARRTPAALAVVQGERRLDFASLADRLERVATGFGLAPGERAAVFSPNCLEYLELVLGLSHAGVPAVLAGATLQPGELAAVLNDAGARVLFVHASLEAAARSAALQTVERIVVLGDEYEQLLAAVPPAQPRPPTDVFLIRYTSGTTGAPKGAVISHRASVARYGLHAEALGIKDASERALVVAPLSAGTAMTYALTTLLAGGACVVHSLFHPQAVLREIERSRITTLSLSPTHLRSIGALGDVELRRHDTGSLRVLSSSGAHLPASVADRAIEIFGRHALHEVYGSTETGTIALLYPHERLRKPRSVGRAFPGCKVVTDGEGQILVRSPILFDGYWNRAEETREAFVDGFFRTGDLGHVDEDGFVHVLGRIDDRINSGGFSFHPAQVEVVLLGHPDVREAVAFAVLDEHLGEVVRALVVCPNGRADESTLLAYAAERLAREHRPRVIEVVDELPRAATGKISRRALRERYRG
jgi:long-chain acyl-CoA synthetase